MRPRLALCAFILLALASVVLLGLGWAAAFMDEPTRTNLLDLHISLGLIGAAMILPLIGLRLIVPPPPYPAHFAGWRKAIASTSELLIYASFAALVLSGLLRALYGGTSLQFFGAPPLDWTAADRPLVDLLGPFWSAPLGRSAISASEFFSHAHRVAAFLSAGAIAAYFGVGAPRRFAAPPIPDAAEEPRPGGPAQPPSFLSPQWALGLAARLRLLGWLQFWLQFVIALAAAVLLQFSTSGRAFSPGASTYGDAIYWGFYGFLLLCAADLLAFYYTRAAKRFVARPDRLSRTKLVAFWFLSAGLLIGLLGTTLSFVGVALSISLLIAKTVSQPPGIAITDPSKIVRALDVFVLLVNFGLLLGHFIGTGVAAWLTATASRALLRYAAARPPNAERV